MGTRKHQYTPLLSLVLITSYATTAQSQEQYDASCSPTPNATISPTTTSILTATPTVDNTAVWTPTFTPTASNTPSPTPSDGTTITPTLQAPTPDLTPTPNDVLVPFGCESKNTADIIATLDSSAQKILKISKLTANSLRKADQSPKVAAFIKKTIATIQALNSQAWTQAWTIPTEITINCISFSTNLCEKKDLSPLVELYNNSVKKMNDETLKINRKLKAFNKRAAGHLASDLRESYESSLASSETLNVETLECKQGSAK